MPTLTQHKQQAEHNKAFTQHLDLDTTFYLDWIVTAAFCAALHFVEWFLTSKGHTGRRDHQLRDVYIPEHSGPLIAHLTADGVLVLLEVLDASRFTASLLLGAMQGEAEVAI